MKADFDIVIVGGGMVGAAMAGLCAGEPRLGELRIALIEAQLPAMPPSDADVDLRVSAISRASERILMAAGAWQLMPADRCSAYSDMRVWDAAGQARGAGSIGFSASAMGEPNLGYIVENCRLQWALLEARPVSERITLLQSQLVALELERDIARVTLSDGRRFSTQLLVAADGAASPSRTLAGIETAGWPYDQHAVVTHVRTGHPHRQTAWQRFLPTGPLALLPLADGRSSIVWSTSPQQAEMLLSLDEASFAAEIEQASDRVLGSVTVAGPRARFPLQLSHAREYCRPHFVLVGDAAHAVHPLAGQGVNLGFMDAASLVQVLAEAMGTAAGVEALGELRVLRRYERWRKSENLLALGLIDGLKRLFGAPDVVAGPLRRAGLSLLDHAPPAKRWLMERALGLAGEVPALVKRA